MKEVYRIFEERRNNMIHLLEKHADELEPDKQHQMFGAINEITVFLNSIEKRFGDIASGERNEKIVTNRYDILKKLNL